MYIVCIDGALAANQAASLPSLDMARGFAIGYSKAVAAAAEQAVVIGIYSEDVLIEAMAHTHWAAYDYKFAGEDS